MLHLLYLIIYAYMAVSTVYLLILAVAGGWAKSIHFERSAVKKNVIVLIPAYKEDVIIVETAEKCARHNYLSTSFEVMVIADSLQKDTLQKLRDIPVDVLEVKFDTSTKAQSLHAALKAVKNKNFEIAVILDADNVMEDDCLEQINAAFHKSCKAVQCHRSAKNQNTSVAQLDAISEEININLFRRGPAALGLSAMPLGSGMAFDFDLLVSIFDTPDILFNPAEDREIEIQLMKRKLRMEFLNDVYVYDEKVTQAAVFQKQRIRWLEAQLNHIRRFFKPDLHHTNKTAVYYHILFQSLLLPRLLYLVICCIIMLIIMLQWLFHVPLIYPQTGYWVWCIVTYFFVLVISVPARYFSLKTLRAITYIPVLMIAMLKAILKLKRNRREFLHTAKTYNTK